MKSVLKKLGVLGLIIAVITPYIYIPKVEAAATNGCTQHLVNYMFQDSGKMYPDSYDWNNNSITEADEKTNYFLRRSNDNKYEANGGYLTYAIFPYHFSESENEKIIIKHTEVNSVPKEQLQTYWSKYNDAATDAYRNTYVDNVNTIGKVFVKNSQFNQNYDTNTIIFHGIWGRDYNGTDDKNNIHYTSNGDLLSMQYKLSGELYDSMKVDITPAEYISSNSSWGDNRYSYNSSVFKLADMNGYNGFADYFQSVIDNGTNVYTDGNGIKYIPLSIRRTFNMNSDDIEQELRTNYKFGHKQGSNLKIYSSNTESITGSYDEFMNASSNYYTKEDSTDYAEMPEVFIRDDSSNSDSYYWPAVLSVEYEICPVNDVEIPEDPEAARWTLKYDSNVTDNSVTNMPSSQDASTKEKITIDSKIPTRKDYVFKGWCTNRDGSGVCKQGGEKISYPGTTPVTLYANWQKDGTTENPKQGVVSYIVGFAAVGLVAGGIYFISKKKNIFKQI